MADPSYQARVYRKQGATAFVIASGGALEIEPGGTLNMTSGRISFPANLAKGHINLDLFGCRALSSAEAILGASVSATGGNLINAIGGLLNANSLPTLTMNSTANQAPVITWAGSVVDALGFPPISVPRDFDSSQSLTINAIAERSSGGASNNVLDFRFWNGTNTTECGTTGSTMTTTPLQYSAIVGATALSAYPGHWSVQIVPGTHTQNTVTLWNAWIEYNKVAS